MPISRFLRASDTGSELQDDDGQRQNVSHKSIAGVVPLQEPTMPTPQSTIASIYQSHDGKWEPTVAAISDMARKDKDLLNYLAGLGARTAVASMTQHDRSAIRSAAPESAMSKASIAAGIQASLRRWLDYPLAGGVKLADATREQLSSAIDVRREQASSMTKMANFLQKVAAKVASGATVADHWNEPQLAKLASETGAGL